MHQTQLTNDMGGLDRMIAASEQEGVATGDPEADRFLRENANAVLIAILLDQQIRAEIAFAGPYKLHQRLGHLDMNTIASMDSDAFKEVFGKKPAIHRFSNMMADRVQNLARAVSEKYDGDAANMWADVPDAATVQKRAKELPGFGAGKVKMIRPVLELFGHKQFS